MDDLVMLGECRHCIVACGNCPDVIRSKVRTAEARSTQLEQRLKEAEETVAVLLAVLPRVIVEAAEDIHTAWLDGRTPDFSEATVTARLDRIVREKFPAQEPTS